MWASSLHFLPPNRNPYSVSRLLHIHQFQPAPTRIWKQLQIRPAMNFPFIELIGFDDHLNLTLKKGSEVRSRMVHPQQVIAYILQRVRPYILQIHLFQYEAISRSCGEFSLDFFEICLFIILGPIAPNGLIVVENDSSRSIVELIPIDTTQVILAISPRDRGF